ncbi:MAG: OsmC family protein [Acidimicrobiales bacterium]
MADETGPRPVHRYGTELRWSGSTGAGYDAYDRAHELTAPPARTGLELSSDPAFRGDPSRLNPEQLLVAAASSCQLLSFLAVAARARLDVVGYADDATAEMPEDDPPVRIVRIELRPRIELADTDRPRPSTERLSHLVEGPP